MYKASQAYACINGRNFVLPEDVQNIAQAVLCHRIVVSGGRRFNETSAYLDEIISNIPVPLEGN